MKNKGKVKIGGSFVKSLVCLVKIGRSFDLLYQNSSLFFTGRKLRLPGKPIRIEANRQTGRQNVGENGCRDGLQAL